MIQAYLQRVQRILGDELFARYNPYDLLDYINEARFITAAHGECIRILCPSTAGVASIAVTAGGSGYTSAPSVALTAPQTGTLAQGAATIAAGAVVGVTVTVSGGGYTTAPSVTFSGGGGTGAAAAASLLPFAQCVAGQETYNFADFASLILSTGKGAASILAIRSIAVSWGSMKPVLRQWAWGDLQAYLRAYNVAAQGFSRVWAQYGRGSTGSFQLWPIPSQNAQMDLDCICLPQDLALNNDQQIEALPYPWTNAVPYKAAQIATLGDADTRDLSDRCGAHYEARIRFATATSTPPIIPDYYDPAGRL